MGVLPPVLPVVLYNGRRRWTAAVEMNDLVAGAEPPLAPYQASQRYYLLDAGRTADADLPSGNLVSALVGLEKGRGRARLRAPLLALIDLLEAQADEGLRQAFAAWVTQMLRAPGRPPAKDLDPLARLKETYTMLEENVREWTREWVEEGRTRGLEEGRTRGLEEGIEQGRGEERALLCRQAARKFDAAAGETLAAALAGVADPERLGRVGDWIIECSTASELLARVRGDGRSGG